MSVTRLAVGAGVVLFGVLCWMAVDGVTFAAVLLITAGALVVLVGGGNWIGGRASSPRGRRPAGSGPPSSTYLPPAADPTEEGQAPPR
ncbi:MAG TPA: hypothetical protein VHW47_00175 [Acidimicrobiales bacterium]|nr:hypothetical protein [Acidimicrobiales bacterium]